MENETAGGSPPAVLVSGAVSSGAANLAIPLPLPLPLPVPLPLPLSLSLSLSLLLVIPAKAGIQGLFTLPLLRMKSNSKSFRPSKAGRVTFLC